MKKFFGLIVCLIIMIGAWISCNNVKTISKQNENYENKLQVEYNTPPNLVNENNLLLEEDDNKEILKKIEKTVTADDAKHIIDDYFGNSCQMTLISDEDKNQKNESYCFLIDYSYIIDEHMSVYAYAYVDYVTGELSFDEAGYGNLNEDELYANIPSAIFPKPTIDGIIAEYDYFSPPSIGSAGTWYTFSNNSVCEQYKLQLKDQGFADLGEVQSVDSLWVYESEDYNIKFITEIYENSICLYVNKF